MGGPEQVAQREALSRFRAFAPRARWLPLVLPLLLAFRTGPRSWLAVAAAKIGYVERIDVLPDGGTIMAARSRARRASPVGAVSIALGAAR